MITLYHAPQSRSSRIVWLLEELGAPYEIRITDIPRMGGAGGVDEANPHPDKKVPAIVHDGALITESSAITLYLTDAFPQNGVGPVVGDPRRGRYLTWLAYYQGVIEPVMTASFAGFADNDGFKRTFTTQAQVHGRILDTLAAGPYLLGENFSAADILLGSMGQWARQMLPPGEVMDAYLQRVGARPALQRAFARDAG